MKYFLSSFGISELPIQKIPNFDKKMTSDFTSPI